MDGRVRYHSLETLGKALGIGALEALRNIQVTNDETLHDALYCVAYSPTNLPSIL